MKVVCHSGGHFYYTPKVLECLYLALTVYLSDPTLVDR